MAIPLEIRQVERPKNTVVKDYFGKYKVVKRTSKYVNGKAIPVDLEIVGEIIDFKFVPFETPIPVGQRSKKKKELVEEEKLMQENKRLIRELELVKAENAYLKKLKAITESKKNK
ncbi:hypothetical protein [Mycoplasma yeatsii]|uniref:hypothetical protein n=1 Tax=Mycoplasma yeatsii TaxID=51365 RepID=UPI00039E4718|nr:hypothetical protein [Mycoplasma yeatsii]